MHENAKPRTGAIALWAAILAITVTGPAAAQLYPGDDVQVNPNAAPRVLLEPDGRHTRVLPALRQPGSDAPIHLHMPVPHRHVARHTAPAASVAIETTTAPPASAPVPASAPPPAVSKPASRKTAVASNPPAPTAASSGNDFSYGWESSVPAAQPASKKPAPKPAQAARVASQPPKAPPPPKPEPAKPARTETASTQTASAPPGDDSFSFETPEIPGATSAPPPAAAPVATKPKTKTPAPQPAQQKPQAQFASAEPPPLETVHREKIGKPEKKSDDHKGLAKQGEVLFAGGSSDPQSASYRQIKSLASDLNGALDSGSGRVEVDAYGGPPGDKSSDARRLSLRRALTVRQLLIDNGVPSDRIDVRALGGAEQGTPDRVDVFVKA